VVGVSAGHPQSRTNDCVRALFEAAHELFARNSQHRDAAFVQPRVPLCVSGRTLTHVVCFAVDFDGEPGGRTIEIQDVWPDWMLTSKDWQVRTPDPQVLP
jgi:hypothetical protein